MDRDLSAEELRLLGALVEKESTTPDQYPLSVNALRNACNQKSSREPVMDLDESSVREAISSLTLRGLVRTASGYGGRVSKFAHRFGSAGSGLELDRDQVAVLCVLFLRGPQTPGELRARSQRIHEFPDTAAVEATLAGLERHPDGPLVRRLPREPGKREHRYLHCFGAETATGSETGSETGIEAVPPAAPTRSTGPVGADLEARVAALEQAVEALQRRLERTGGTDWDSDGGDPAGP